MPCWTCWSRATCTTPTRESSHHDMGALHTGTHTACGLTLLKECPPEIPNEIMMILKH